MLKELSHYENLGTPQYFWEFLNALGKDVKQWSIKEVQEYFFNRIIDGRSIFDGCIPLAQTIGILQIEENGKILIDSTCLEFLRNKQYLKGKLIERIIWGFKSDVVFFDIFSAENISYDIIYHSIQINNSAFHFKYANFKQLLIDFDFLLLHPDKGINKFTINSKYKKLFDKTILHEIKKRKIGIDELKMSLELQQTYGEEAEKFVLQFENRRLEEKKSIDWIAEYWANAGYDIASYNDIDATKQNRFIEVKSYSGIPNFFWSKNEIETARIKRDEYFLYLVNRSQMKFQDYVPMIIQNPYSSVLKNDKWDQQVEKYFVSFQQE